MVEKFRFLVHFKLLLCCLDSLVYLLLSLRTSANKSFSSLLKSLADVSTREHEHKIAFNFVVMQLRGTLNINIKNGNLLL